MLEDNLDDETELINDIETIERISEKIFPIIKKKGRNAYIK